MDLSLEFRTPIEKRHPSKVVSRSRTPNIFMPSLETRVVLTATLPVVILRRSRAKTFDTRPQSTRESAEVNSSINHWRRQTMKNIVLVHGGFVDGAGWEGVYKILKRDGYSVSIVQNPTISL